MGKSIYLLLAYALFSACTVQVTAQKQVSEEKIEPFSCRKIPSSRENKSK